MGRRKSSSSSTDGGGDGSKKRNKATSAASTNDHHHAAGGGGTVEQLSMLRSFLGMETNSDTVMLCGHLITESDLMDCHRKSGYNVQLAAERLMTGEYHQQMKQKKKSNNCNSAFTQKSSNSTSGTGSHPSKRKDPPPMTAVKKKVNVTTASSTSAAAKAITPATTTKTAVTSKIGPPSLSSNRTNTALTSTAGSFDDSSSSSSGGWLLCQRWLSDAVCTVRSGRIQYQEVLTIEHAYMSSNKKNKTSNATSVNNAKKSSAAESTCTSPTAYVTSIRFRGTRHGVTGRLPDNIATLLTPLLKHDNSMIYIHAQALMEMNTLVTGSEIPISLTIYLTNPRTFFQLFEPPHHDNGASNTKCSTGTQFWETQKLLASSSSSAAAGGNSNNLQWGKRRRMPLVQQAAFDLLQWAEYGDVPDFVKAAPPPASTDGATSSTTTGSAAAAAAAKSVDEDGDDADAQGDEDETEEENLLELSESEFDKAGEENETGTNDDDDASAATAAPLLAKDWGAGSDTAAALLPEAPEDPVGFKEGIRLCRPYQSQALYWMLQREKGILMDSSNSTTSSMEPDSVMQEQMNLLSELVAVSTKQQQRRPSSLQPQQGDVVCECGPVLLSEKAQAQTKTLNGQALCSVVTHPLWSRRFLVKATGAFVDAANLSLSNKNININNTAETLCFHVNEVLGVARHEPPEPPTPCRGGILADSMGLGKTVMLLALILASKQERQQQQAGQTKRTTSTPSATLIVVKLSMLPQWQDEIESKTNLTYSIYYGPGSNNVTSVQQFHNVDIVLTTYGTIQGEAALRRATSKKQPVLLQHEWLRVILDEAHCIKNTSTLASKACCNLKARYRWCVSGTIIQNSVEDLFGLLKFLHHEPWCLSPFWKAAITKPMVMTMTASTNTGDSKNNSSIIQDQDKMAREREEAVRLVLDRLRRILAPIMLRRTKDSRTLDGKPILTLPPVETQVVHVELSPAEREFYNGVLARSLTLFEGFVDSGTAARSYLQILSMISRLRQTCDHIALTVRTRMEDEDWNAAIFDSNDGSSDRDDDDDDDGTAVKPRSKKTSTPATTSSRSNGASNDAIGKQFLQGLLAKFCTKSSPRKKKERNDDDMSTAEGESPSQKRPRNEASLYLCNVANALTDAVKANATHVEEECPVCLERPALHLAVLTPCAHIFCRECLLGVLRENAKSHDCNSDAAPNKSMAFHCPDGKCPCCSKDIQASRIVALSKSGPNGETLTSCYLTSMKPPSSSSAAAVATRGTAMSQVSDKNDVRDDAAQACMAARTILDSTMKDVSSVESSKMQAVMQELDRVWQMDPGSKVIIFSQFLGFLDLMENRLSRVGIPFFRLDGRLSLKGRMNVLEHFRSCDDNDKVNNNKKKPPGAATLRSGSSLVDTAAKTDEGDSTTRSNSPKGNNSIERGTVLLMSMSAGGEGLNLVAASSVFLVDPWWNSAREDQCVNRIHRIGQKASVVRVRKFVTVDTVEESIVQLQSRKKYMADQVYNDNGDTTTKGNSNDDGGGTARLNLDDFKLIFRKE